LASELLVVIAPQQTTLLNADGIMECLNIPALYQITNCSTAFLLCIVNTCMLQS